MVIVASLAFAALLIRLAVGTALVVMAMRRGMDARLRVGRHFTLRVSRGTRQDAATSTAHDGD
jgi:hypothetical protein